MSDNDSRLLPPAPSPAPRPLTTCPGSERCFLSLLPLSVPGCAVTWVDHWPASQFLRQKGWLPGRALRKCRSPPAPGNNTNRALPIPLFWHPLSDHPFPSRQTAETWIQHFYFNSLLPLILTGGSSWRPQASPLPASWLIVSGILCVCVHGLSCSVVSDSLQPHGL